MNAGEPFFVSQQVTDASRYYLNLKPSGDRGLEVVCGGVERMRREYVVRRTDFPFYALELVVEGAGTLELDGRRYALEPGVMFAYGPGVAHTICTDPENRMRKYYVDFWGSEARALLDASGLGQWRVLRVSAVHELTEIFHALRREARSEGTLNHAVCETLARLLLLKVQQNAVPGGDRVPRSFATYERLRRHIEEHYRRLHSVEEAAAECGVTQVHASRLFQRFAQAGAYQFLV